MPEESNNEAQNPEIKDLEADFECAPEDHELITWRTSDDALADAALGFGLGALATILVVSVASIFKR